MSVIKLLNLLDRKEYITKAKIMKSEVQELKS